MLRILCLFVCIVLSSLFLKAQDVIVQAEFEKNEGIILKWNYQESLDSVVSQIASIISADDKVWILTDPGQTTVNSGLPTTLASFGADITNITFLDGVAENPWLRDYGPFGGYYISGSEETRHFIDAQYSPEQFPLADFLPLQLASDFGFSYDAAPINFEYGNLVLDGIGRGYVSDRVLTENPGMSTNQVIQTLYTKLSLNEIILLPSIPECGGGIWGELSRLIKFVDPETVFVVQFPESVSYSQQVDAIADTLSRTYNDVGKLLQVIRVPAAPDENGEFALDSAGIIRSYTSSIVFNNKILIPSYNSPSDATALELYRQVFHGYEIFQIPSLVLNNLHGSLFRMAVNIPQPTLFRIRHSKFSGMQPFQNEVWINTFVQSINPVDSIQLFYRIHPSTAYQVMNTYGCCGGNSGYLSGYSISDTISYYLQAYGGDHIQTLPLGAADATYTFWFDSFTSVKQLSGTQDLKIFPNPATNYIKIEGISYSDKDVSYQIINVKGLLVAEGHLQKDAIIRFPDTFANGFYIIKVVTTGKTHLCKLYLHR